MDPAIESHYGLATAPGSGPTRSGASTSCSQPAVETEPRLIGFGDHLIAATKP
jgi:hypothetical protein